MARPSLQGRIHGVSLEQLPVTLVQLLVSLEQLPVTLVQLLVSLEQLPVRLVQLLVSLEQLPVTLDTGLLHWHQQVAHSKGQVTFYGSE